MEPVNADSKKIKEVNFALHFTIFLNSTCIKGEGYVWTYLRINYLTYYSLRMKFLNFQIKG